MSTRKDPVRLLLDADVPEGQRALLRHDASFAPPPEAADQVWKGLAGALGAAAVAGAATQASKARSTLGTTATNLAAVVLALGLLTAAIVVGVRVAAPPVAPPPTAPVASAPKAAAPALAPPTERVAGERSPWADTPASEANHARPPVASPKPAPRIKPRPAAPPGEESTLIDQARLALRSGDPTRALKLLEECRRVFPAGAREEERELLTIQALVSAVRGTEAKARAAAFLRRYPDGPRAREVRALGLGAPEKMK
jgi:hypothetical protein